MGNKEITKKQAQERAEFLRQELNRHNYRYYVLNDPEISDFEYDVMMMELASIEKMYPELTTPSHHESRQRHSRQDAGCQGVPSVPPPLAHAFAGKYL